MHTPELLSILYELSLTNLKYSTPKDTAKSFVKKFISRKSLNAGAVWTFSEISEKTIILANLFSTPSNPENIEIEASPFLQLFRNDSFIVSNHSLFNNRKMEGTFAYFKLNDFGLLELFSLNRNGSFTKESLVPFKDVIAQFAISLESGFNREKLQLEVKNRTRAERLLKTSEEKYRRIIDNVQLGLLDTDNEGRIQHANTAFLSLSGYTLQELTGRQIEDIIIDKSTEIPSAEGSDYLQDGNSPTRIKGKDGNIKWCILSKTPNYNKEGEHVGSIGIFMDLTEQKKLREENAFKTDQLKKLFEKSLDALISIDSDGNVFEWSPRAEEIFGYSKKEIMGKKISDTIIPNVHRQAHNQGMINYLATGHGPVLNSRVEIIGLHKKGRVFPIELTVFPMEYDDKKYFTAFIRDITEIKESKEEMERALERQKELNALKSQFISTTSHELRTPLTTIRSNTELLNFKLENPGRLNSEKMKKNVSRIEHNVERLNQLINNILMIGKIDSQKTSFKPRSIDVLDYINAQILPDFHSRDQQIKISKSGKGKFVDLDPNLFHHILSNLLENAIKYSTGRQKPELHLIYEDKFLTIKVVDFGIGIPEEDKKRLFETFFRAGNVDNIQGTGLGLTIVKQYMEAHSGSIDVQSKEGLGTTFSLRFPYHQENAKR